MKILQFLRVVCLAVLVSTLVVSLQFGIDPMRDLVRYVSGSPHDRYAVMLTWGPHAGTPSAQAWLHSAEGSVAAAVALKGSTQTVRFEGDAPSAAAFAVTLRRGQRFVVEPAIDAAADDRVFIDLLRRDESSVASVAYATEPGAAMEVEIERDGEYVVRIQPELGAAAVVALSTRMEPTLRLPVEQSGRRSIGSLYGAPRDGGRRDHHGVDIFAKRGTPVVAASSGIVTHVGTNGLGGKVVWISRPMRGEAHYYAHLDEQLVTVGTHVEEGDVIGRVGNTGNARSTPPHLHFGIYTPGGAVDPLPYLADL